MLDQKYFISNNMILPATQIANCISASGGFLIYLDFPIAYSPLPDFIHNNYKVFHHLPKSRKILLDKNNLEAYKLINLGTYEKRCRY
jgi:hypothetical protein